MELFIDLAIIILLALAFALVVTLATTKRVVVPKCKCKVFFGDNLRCPKHGVHRKSLR